MLALLGLAALQLLGAAVAAKPHIITLVIDDLGWYVANMKTAVHARQHAKSLASPAAAAGSQQGY